MNRIPVIYKARLKTATHIEVNIQLSRLSSQLAITTPKYVRLNAAHQSALQKESADYKADQGSDLTKLIEEADLKRDRALGNISAVAHAFSIGYGTEQQTTIANAVVKILKKFKASAADQYDQETGALRQVIDEVRASNLDLSVLSLDIKHKKTKCRK